MITSLRATKLRSLLMISLSLLAMAAVISPVQAQTSGITTFSAPPATVVCVNPAFFGLAVGLQPFCAVSVEPIDQRADGYRFVISYTKNGQKSTLTQDVPVVGPQNGQYFTAEFQFQVDQIESVSATPYALLR